MYKYEIIVFAVDVLLIFISFIFINQIKLIFLISSLILVLSLFIVVYFRTNDKDFYYLPLNKPGQDKDWSGRGTFKFIHNEHCYEITNSGVGYIFPKTVLWDDYKYEFDFKIINKCMTWIVRAVNLSNYVMFQCTFDGINPIIRLSGEWIIKKHTDSDVNMTFGKKLNLDAWYRGIVICEKRSIRIAIYDYKDTKIIFDRHFIIPEGIKVKFLKEKLKDDQEKTEANEYVELYQSIDFDFGAIGIRNWANERGLIKEIYIEKI